MFTIQDLSKTSGVSVASIKFYLREALLPPGDPTRPGRSYYDDAHVKRLAVIRAMRDVGGLSIDVIRRALAAVDAPAADAVDAIAPAIDALAPARSEPPVDATLRKARAMVDELFTREKLAVRAEAGSRETVARTLAALWRVGMPLELPELRIYLDAMRGIADLEIARPETRAMLLSEKETSLLRAILGTVLFEPLLVGLRRALHEHYTTRLVRRRVRRR